MGEKSRLPGGGKADDWEHRGSLIDASEKQGKEKLWGLLGKERRKTPPLELHL